MKRHDNFHYNPRKKSTGFLNELFTLVENEASTRADGVYVENVFNEWMPDWLKRRGYIEISGTYPLSYYKLISNL